MVDSGQWLLLTLVFSLLLLLVLRSERKRRLPSFLIMAFVGLIVWRYAIYRISGDCGQAGQFQVLQIVCRTDLYRQRGEAIAYNTANLSILIAVLFNMFFWVFLGRSNPPASSDAIRVYGLDDYEEENGNEAGENVENK